MIFNQITDISNITFHNVMGKNCDVLVTVRPRVFMVETKSMKNLMDDVTHGAQGTNEHRLLTPHEAHI